MCVRLIAGVSRSEGQGHAARVSRLCRAFSVLNVSARWAAIVDDESKSAVMERWAPDGIVRNAADARRWLDEVPKEQQSLLVMDMLDTTASAVRGFRSEWTGPIVHMNPSGAYSIGADAYLDVDGSFRAGIMHADAVVFSGLQYAILDPDVSTFRRMEIRPVAADPHVLVACGGSDPGGCTEEIAAALVARAHSNATLVVGTLWTEARSNALRKSGVPFKMAERPASLLPLISESDIVIALGGSIALECMCLGVPTVLRAWDRLAEFAWDYHRRGLTVAGASAQESVRVALDEPSRLMKCAETAWRQVDGGGALRAAQVLSEVSRRQFER
jgi:spore coat polysaccharide biosynthesis predicted glycosyltransferase SpsG